VNILHIVPYFYPAWSYGGTPRVVFELCRELVKKGHNVTVYTTDVFDKHNPLTPFSKGDYIVREVEGLVLSEVEGIKIKYFRNISNSLAFNQKVFISPGISKALKENLKQFDIVHLNEFRTLQNIAAYKYLMKYKIPYVLSAHGSVLRLMGKEFLKMLFDKFIGFKILKSAKRVVAVSNIEMEQYVSMGVPRDKITIIPNGVNLSEFNNAKQLKGKFRERHKLSDKKILLFVGRLNAIKGLDFLMNTFAILAKEIKDTILVIAGPDDGYKGEVERRINLLKINDTVLLLDGLYGEDKISAMIDADIFIYPSRHEIFGIAPLEALMCGTPVIVTENCGCADFLKKVDSEIVVRYQDISGLLKTIRDILDSKGNKRIMALRGMELVQEKFNWDEIAKNMIELYKTS
jgi:glycosyltransferase involved in cell wall biosynthesis